MRPILNLVSDYILSRSGVLKVVEKDIQPATKTNIEQYRNLVLNPFSHYNTEKHEFKTELNDAIVAVKTLRDELSKGIRV